MHAFIQCIHFSFESHLGFKDHNVNNCIYSKKNSSLSSQNVCYLLVNFMWLFLAHSFVQSSCSVDGYWFILGRSRHTFTAEELAEIEARPPEAYLAKPPRVKAWNLKRAKELGLTGTKSLTERLGESVLVAFPPPKGPRVSTLMSMELTANEIKTKMFEIAGIALSHCSLIISFVH
jgi:hypothetical protein